MKPAATTRIVRMAVWFIAFALACVACATEGTLGAGQPSDPGGPDGGDAAVVEGGAIGPTSTPRDGGNTGTAPDGGKGGGGSPCPGLLESMLRGATIPPYTVAGIDLVRGADVKGLTFDELNADGCAVLTPAEGNGFRIAKWGGDDGVMVTYNSESGIIYQVFVGPSYQGKVAFHSNAAGRFGPHTYELGVGTLLRDGVAMPVDWSDLLNAPWADELNVALVTTFASDPFVGAPDCLASNTCLVVDDDGDGHAIFGARDLSFYVTFEIGTNRITGFYNIWKAGQPDCTTPRAAHEAMDVAQIEDGSFGRPAIGGLNLSRPAPNGVTRALADARLCGGVAVAPDDPGYGAIAWGPAGELELEYNRTTDVAYKLIAKPGYKGALYGYDSTKQLFAIQVGKVTKNDVPLTFDPSSVADVTALSNVFSALNDTDCVAAGHCILTADNGRGHSEIELVTPQVHIVFPKTSPTAPDAIYFLWNKGK